MLMKKIETEEMTRELDIGKVKEMLVLVQSILRSKPLCQLTEEELEHLSIIILKVCRKLLGKTTIFGSTYVFFKSTIASTFLVIFYVALNGFVIKSIFAR